MSYPILYSATETSFDNNGLGILGDCVSCEVTEEANGIFELAMRYPMDGLHFAEIGDRAIIKAKADQFRDPQLFRVYAISKPMSGIVTVLAEHISYDLSGIPVRPFSASSVASALSGLKNNAVVDCPFDFWTDKPTESNFSVSVPSSIRSMLGGSAGSIISVYGGDLEFDNYTVKLHNNRGMNRGVSIRYGKNLMDIQQEQNCSNVATGVYPYWTDMNGESLIELPERIVNASGTYNFVKIKTLDLSQVFLEQPTLDQIRNYTQKYIVDNKIGVPKVSLTISFAQLDQTQEYNHMKLLERVSLFDTVNVEFTALGVSAVASAVKMVYDVLSDRVKSVTLGSARANIADTIASQRQEIQKAPTKSDLEKAKEAATAWLTNGKGYAYFRKDDLGNIVDILFMDTQDISTAVNVMRVGQSGIGFSHNGVNGPYESAWTIDGEFVADWIKSGTLDANLVNVINLVANNITSGKISSSDGGTYFDLDSGAIVSQTSESKLIFYGSSLRLNRGDTTRLNIAAGSGNESSRIMFFNENGDPAFFISQAIDTTTGKDYIGIGMPNADGSGFVAEWVCWKTFAGVPMITSPDAELSVDLTGEVKNALPIANGGTDATTAAAARQNINVIGLNPITSASKDSPATWKAFGTGVAYFNKTGCITDQPTTNGLLQNYVYNNTVLQEWFVRGKAPRKLVRTGQAGSGWNSSWIDVSIAGQTDYVTATGTSGAWRYWKFNSGLCIAMGNPIVSWGTPTAVATNQTRSTAALNLTGIFTAVMGGTCSNAHRHVNCFVIPSGGTSAELWATTAVATGTLNVSNFSTTPHVVLFGKWK